MPGTFEDSRFFHVRVARIEDITPSFRRFTFAGPDLAEFGDPGFDQRIKVVFPTPGGPLDSMPTGVDWYGQWRQEDASRRPALRTYTTRAVRRPSCEMDIDMVVHPPAGPAARWIRDAVVGDELLLFGPTAGMRGVSLGVDFVPPRHTGAHLLAGDETAAPAIAVILEQLPATSSGVVVLEVPEEADLAYLPSHPGFRVRAGARVDEGGRGSFLVPQVKAAAAELAPAGRGAQVEEIDVDRDLLWEVPRTAKGGAALKSAALYAWLAGEAASIKELRRHLVGELGVDRRAVAFMGYWRAGRPEC